MTMKENILKTELLDYASKLDAETSSRGEISRDAWLITDEQDISATNRLVNLTSQIVKSADHPKDVKRLSMALKDGILRFYGYIHIVDATAKAQGQQDDDIRTLSELLDELDELIGLDSVKAKVNDLIAYQKIQKLREQNGLHSQKGTMHLAFTGNPGTGKTTVARIVGRIYKQLGLLSKGHFVEVSRTDLIAGYQGQTALKVKKVIERAKGGVLFIDEAYSITENDHSDSYGRECLTELTKALEDYRDDLVVIVAGYTEPMEHFFESNPGLKSRFNTFIEFPDYSGDQLHEMLVRLCHKNDYELSEDVSKALRGFLEEQVGSKAENFSNGRLVRNLYDDLVMCHAKRVFASDISNPNREILSSITIDDFKSYSLARNEEEKNIISTDG
jgi:SpoVK/Ycf46/Vps4 family AAA+-type ATPase